jgi:lipoprotein-anchoring transpeptidase ErfK/SrfK
MEPFAIQETRRSRAPWIVALLLAAGFAVWRLDVIPRIRTAATGSLTSTETAVPSADSELQESWDEIVDRTHTGEAAPEELVEDPLNDAIDAESRSVRRVGGQRSRKQVSTADGHGDSESEAELNVDEVGDVDDTRVERVSLEVATEQKQPQPEKSSVISAELAEKLRQIDDLYRDDQILETHAELSRIYWNQPSARAIIRTRIEHTAGIIYGSPEKQFNEPYIVQPGETLDEIARAHDISWQYLATLNRTSPETLQAGQELKVLKGPFSAVVDLGEYSMTIHAHGWYVNRYQIGIGKDNRTPTGEFTVQDKLENPVWYNPDGGVVDADDPENPLGEYWLGLGDHIGIHGTIDPTTIGRSASRGCIHLADPDIAEVFNLLTVGSKVLIRN